VRTTATASFGRALEQASSAATSTKLHRVRLEHIADELVANLAHGQQRQLEIVWRWAARHG
jgi:ABC-type branched-subunit amino acid transport system ATPase component